ncbi:MAG: phage tail assembly chaperone [Pseudomonadota bacterium]
MSDTTSLARNDGDAPKPFPWKSVMAFGLGELRLSPAAFWSLSLPELNQLLPKHQTEIEPPCRSDLDRLMADFPDQ